MNVKLRELVKVLCSVQYDIIEVDLWGEYMNRYKFRYVGGQNHGVSELEARIRLSKANVLKVSNNGSVVEITVRTPSDEA